MDSTVKSRPNHYELLGLGPTATLDEIDEAFARELRLPRAFGSLAEFTVAYETLRDPAKRKAYDASIFKPEPKPEPRPALSLAGRLEGAALATRPVAQLKTSRPFTAPRLRPDPRPQARTAPSATALLHQPITPRIPQRDPAPQAKQEPVRPAEPVARPQPEPRPADDYALCPPVADHAEYEQHAQFQWKLPALAAGALILAIGGGAWMGVESGNDAPEDQLKPVVTLKVPPARAAAPIAAASAVETPGMAAEPTARPARPAAPASADSARPPLQIDLPDEQPSEVAALEQQQRDIEQAAAPALAVAATNAKMPLPNSVIARTIGRIGYPCGQVASTTAVDGAAGVFAVTCTSGHSYRAAPVHGRYRFRRMGKS
jgi:hypothetical protein